MLPSAPVLPVLDAVRVANPDDLPRLALVAAAGFFHSPTFHYQRLHHAEYPDDTILYVVDCAVVVCLLLPPGSHPITHQPPQ